MSEANGARFNGHGRAIAPGIPLDDQPTLCALLATALGVDLDAASDRVRNEDGSEDGTDNASAPASEAEPAQPSGLGGAGKDTAVDLAAWARGDREYISADVRLAIVERFGTLVADRREALRFLIDQGVVTPQAAREDV